MMEVPIVCLRPMIACGFEDPGCPPGDLSRYSKLGGAEGRVIMKSWARARRRLLVLSRTCEEKGGQASHTVHRHLQVNSKNPVVRVDVRLDPWERCSSAHKMMALREVGTCTSFLLPAAVPAIFKNPTKTAKHIFVCFAEHSSRWKLQQRDSRHRPSVSAPTMAIFTPTKLWPSTCCACSQPTTHPNSFVQEIQLCYLHVT